MYHKIELTIEELKVVYASLRMFEGKCNNDKRKGVNYSILAEYEIMANHIALIIKDILENEKQGINFKA